MTKGIVPITISVIIASSIFYLTQQVIQTWNTAIRYEHIQKCVEISQISYSTDTEAKVTEPGEHWMKRCLDAKGIR